MSTSNEQIFEILISDETGKSEITTIQSLNMALAYSERLWKHSEIKHDSQNEIVEDTTLGIVLKPTKVNGNYTSFLITIQNVGQSDIEDFKSRLFHHIINKLGFGNIRITYDSVSEKISLDVIPFIKLAENTARRVLLKSTIIGSGIEGFESSFPKAIGKINHRKSITNEYQNDVVYDTLQVDFEDIGQLIGNDTSLREELGEQWDMINQIRQKVLSNAPFTYVDLENAQKASSELVALLTGNEIKPSFQPTFQPVFQQNYIEPVQVEVPNVVVNEPVYSNNNFQEPQTYIPAPEPFIPEPVQVPEPAPIPVPQYVETPQPVVVQQMEAKQETTPVSSAQSEAFAMITDEIFLEELKKVEAQNIGRKINLKSFVSETLAEKGYGTGPAYFASRNLSANGKITVSEVKENGLWIKVVNSN